MMNKIIFSLLCIGFLNFAIAEGIIQTDKQTQLNFEISQEDITLIEAPGDRIDRVWGNSGSYAKQLEEGRSIIDDQLGIVFIKPLTNNPFSLFLATEGGQYFHLQLIPSDKDPETIRLQSKNNEALTHWEQSTPYLITLISLTKAMMQGIVLPGFQLIDPSQAFILQSEGDLQAKLTKIYQGKRLRGEVYHLSNENNEILQLKELNWYLPRTLSIAFDNHFLSPQEGTYLYRIISND